MLTETSLLMLIRATSRNPIWFTVNSYIRRLSKTSSNQWSYTAKGFGGVRAIREVCVKTWNFLEWAVKFPNFYGKNVSQGFSSQAMEHDAVPAEISKAKYFVIVQLDLVALLHGHLEK